VEKRKKRENEKRALENRIRVLEEVQRSPTATIRNQLSRTSITAQANLPITPCYTTTASQQRNNIFGQSGGQGNLLYATRPGQTAPRQPPTPQQTTALHARLNNLIHHPDTDAGRAAYRAQLAKWETKHGQNARVTEETPYPLRPGTATVCSGECWICGTNGHRRDQCPITIGSPMCISAKEGAWRRICNTILGAFNKVTAIPVQLVALEQYDYEPGTAWVEELGSHEGEGQGKGEGSSV